MTINVFSCLWNPKCDYFMASMYVGASKLQCPGCGQWCRLMKVEELTPELEADLAKLRAIQDAAHGSQQRSSTKQAT